jgi:hypothetical protein
MGNDMANRGPQMSDTIQSADELAERIMLDNIDFEDETFDIRGAADYIKSDRLALIAAIRADEARKQAERYASCVEALEEISKIDIRAFSCQDAIGTTKILFDCGPLARKTLADLEAPK